MRVWREVRGEWAVKPPARPYNDPFVSFVVKKPLCPLCLCGEIKRPVLAHAVALIRPNDKHVTDSKFAGLADIRCSGA